MRDVWQFVSLPKWIAVTNDLLQSAVQRGIYTFRLSQMND